MGAPIKATRRDAAGSAALPLPAPLLPPWLPPQLGPLRSRCVRARSAGSRPGSRLRSPRGLPVPRGGRRPRSWAVCCAPSAPRAAAPCPPRPASLLGTAGPPPGLARPQPPDTALLALAALTLGADPPGPLPPPFPSRASAPLSSLGVALLSPTSREPSQPSPSPPQSPLSFSLSPPSSPPSPLYKTELCRPFTATGRCRYGARCQFAHGPEELRGLRRHPKYRTQPCSTFQRCGTCPYGSRCHFLHGPAPAEGSAGSPGSPHRLPVFDRISVSE
ncbi:mRNA decay activator protein ZFP36-like isoform X1 [Gallus gallus]|uniref:mRNA decay activator protein ZFP36-like isoform X1 n=1 Tax=Gallus gallus TaxID=9031 RepID=UPI001AE92A01|nr:mRNA decay activator protein ZFP36-like isoform X1 [Gallus gallus]